MDSSDRPIMFRRHDVIVLKAPAAVGPAELHGMPVVVFHSKELRKAGLDSGDPVLVEANNCRARTIAICEVGGQEGGVQLARSVAKSLGIDGEAGSVRLSSSFEACEATHVDLEVPRVLHEHWSDEVGNLRLEQFVAAILDGSLLFPGDYRTLHVNGKSWDLRVKACGRCAKQGVSSMSTYEQGGGGPQITPLADEHAKHEADSPWLVGKRTRLRVEPYDCTNHEGVSGGVDGFKAVTSRGFSRVGGLRCIVDELREAIQMPLENPDMYKRLGIRPPRGVLLYGLPGTGKTLLAKALSEELRCPVELCASTDLVSAGTGEAEDRIRAVFDKCRQQAAQHGAGTLLFIDEIDAVCPKRDDSGEAERRMVAAFLTALDGAKGDDGVVVLGATNRPDAIDPALRRAGRLEREIETGVPNAEERVQILSVHLSEMQHTLDSSEQQHLARRCHGYVGADLRTLCDVSARLALQEGNSALQLKHCLEAMSKVPPSALKELLVEVPEVRWIDIGGYAATKEALREAVEWPIKHAWAFDAMGVDPPRGILLYGPPGCSKTMMAKAVATETEMNFVSIKGPELFSKYVGDSERSVRNVFRKARAAAPCVVFFDEIDAIGSCRDSEGSGGVASRVLTQLLSEMDGIGSAASQRHVVVLAATNRPHVLDTALLRPGRFDRLVHVPLPDEAARTAIFQRQLSKMIVEDTVDATVLSSHASGRSGAEVVMICREAAMLAIREALQRRRGAGAGVVTEEFGSSDVCVARSVICNMEHFQRAIATVMPRIDKSAAQFYHDFEHRAHRS